MSDQIKYSQVIEFFWFFFPFILFILGALLKFYIKTTIHDESDQNRAKSSSQVQLGQKYAQPKQTEDIQGNEIQIDGDAHQQQGPVLSSISPNISENSRTAKLFNGINELISTHFPLLSISILCINNFAVWGWAVACVFLYIFTTLLFNIIQVQKNMQGNIKQVLYLCNHIWIFGLFIDYLACKLKLSS